MPFPVIAFIVGVVIGFMASPSVEISLITGGFLAMLCWAVQGFPVGYKSKQDSNEGAVYTQNSQCSRADSTPERREFATPINTGEENINDIELVFGDGTKLTSQQLGYFSFGWSDELAGQILEEFAPGRVASAFPSSIAITESPFMARLHLTLFHSAAYLSYLTTILRAPAESVPYFLAGLNDALKNVTHPSWSVLSGSEREKLLEIVSEFANAIDQDFEDATTDGSDAFNPSNAPVTNLLIDKLFNLYPNSADRTPLSTYGIGQLLNDAPPSLMVILKENLGLRLAS